MNSQTPPPPLEAAQYLSTLRVMPIPILFGEKNPNRRGWEQERYKYNELPSVFNGNPMNIGMRLGHILASDGQVLTDRFIDVDLDTLEAVRAAPFYLPTTGMVWGRERKPRSHYGFRLTSAEGVRPIVFNDPTVRKSDKQTRLKAMLCELRWTGHTLAPGSTNNADGVPDLVRWEEGGKGKPSDVDYSVLASAIAMVAAVALLARNWLEGVRHSASLPLAGMLCRGGMLQPQAERFVEALCAASSDSQLADRLRAVQDTYSKAAAGQPYTSSSALQDFIDPIVVKRLRKWLNLGSGAYGGDVGPDGWPLSDVGNAERFAAKWEGKTLHCETENAWLLLGSERWEYDTTNRIYIQAKEVYNDFRAIAHNPATPNQGNTTMDQWIRHSQKLGERRQITAMVELAKADLAVESQELDANAFLLNVQNGTIELNAQKGTVVLRSHRPEDHLTSLMPVVYDPEATHPLLAEFLDLFYPDPELRAFLQEHACYALTGFPKRYSLELVGPSNAGKSMTLEMFGRLMGDYGDSLPYESLMRNPHKGGDVARPDLWRIRKKRLITISEIPPDTHYDVALFKLLLSGGDQLPIRTLYDRLGGEKVGFVFSLWTSGNQPYGPPPSEAAAYERLHVLRCPHVVPSERRDPLRQQQTVDPAITGSATLAWVLKAFPRVWGEHKGVLIPPEQVKRTTAETQDTLDPWAEIVDELFVVTGDRKDGVRKADAWSMARKTFEYEQGKPVRNPRREQWAFEACLERRCGSLPTRSDGRWRNQEYWPGVAWQEGKMPDGAMPSDW